MPTSSSFESARLSSSTHVRPDSQIGKENGLNIIQSKTERPFAAFYSLTWAKPTAQVGCVALRASVHREGSKCETCGQRRRSIRWGAAHHVLMATVREITVMPIEQVRRNQDIKTSRTLGVGDANDEDKRQEGEDKRQEGEDSRAVGFRCRHDRIKRIPIYSDVLQFDAFCPPCWRVRHLWDMSTEPVDVGTGDTINSETENAETELRQRQRQRQRRKKRQEGQIDIEMDRITIPQDSELKIEELKLPRSVNNEDMDVDESCSSDKNKENRNKKDDDESICSRCRQKKGPIIVEGAILLTHLKSIMIIGVDVETLEMKIISKSDLQRPRMTSAECGPSKLMIDPFFRCMTIKLYEGQLEHLTLSTLNPFSVSSHSVIKYLEPYLHALVYLQPPSNEDELVALCSGRERVDSEIHEAEDQQHPRQSLAGGSRKRTRSELRKDSFHSIRNDNNKIKSYYSNNNNINNILFLKQLKNKKASKNFDASDDPSIQSVCPCPTERQLKMSRPSATTPREDYPGSLVDCIPLGGLPARNDKVDSTGLIVSSSFHEEKERLEILCRYFPPTVAICYSQIPLCESGLSFGRLSDSTQGGKIRLEDFCDQESAQPVFLRFVEIDDLLYPQDSLWNDYKSSFSSSKNKNDLSSSRNGSTSIEAPLGTTWLTPLLIANSNWLSGGVTVMMTNRVIYCDMFRQNVWKKIARSLGSLTEEETKTKFERLFRQFISFLRTPQPVFNILPCAEVSFLVPVNSAEIQVSDFEPNNYLAVDDEGTAVTVSLHDWVCPKLHRDARGVLVVPPAEIGVAVVGRVGPGSGLACLDDREKKNRNRNSRRRTLVKNISEFGKRTDEIFESFFWLSSGRGRSGVISVSNEPSPNHYSYGPPVVEHQAALDVSSGHLVPFDSSDFEFVKHQTDNFCSHISYYEHFEDKSNPEDNWAPVSDVQIIPSPKHTNSKTVVFTSSDSQEGSLRSLSARLDLSVFGSWRSDPAGFKSRRFEILNPVFYFHQNEISEVQNSEIYLFSVCSSLLSPSSSFLLSTICCQKSSASSPVPKLQIINELIDNEILENMNEKENDSEIMSQITGKTISRGPKKNSKLLFSLFSVLKSCLNNFTVPLLLFTKLSTQTSLLVTSKSVFIISTEEDQNSFSASTIWKTDSIELDKQTMQQDGVPNDLATIDNVSFCPASQNLVLSAADCYKSYLVSIQNLSLCQFSSIVVNLVPSPPVSAVVATPQFIAVSFLTAPFSFIYILNLSLNILIQRIKLTGITAEMENPNENENQMGDFGLYDPIVKEEDIFLFSLLSIDCSEVSFNSFTPIYSRDHLIVSMAHITEQNKIINKKTEEKEIKNKNINLISSAGSKKLKINQKKFLGDIEEGASEDVLNVFGNSQSSPVEVLLVSLSGGSVLELRICQNSFPKIIIKDNNNNQKNKNLNSSLIDENIFLIDLLSVRLLQISEESENVHLQSSRGQPSSLLTFIPSHLPPHIFYNFEEENNSNINSVGDSRSLFCSRNCSDLFAVRVASGMFCSFVFVDFVQPSSSSGSSLSPVGRQSESSVSFDSQKFSKDVFESSSTLEKRCDKILSSIVLLPNIVPKLSDPILVALSPSSVRLGAFPGTVQQFSVSLLPFGWNILMMQYHPQTKTMIAAACESGWPSEFFLPISTCQMCGKYETRHQKEPQLKSLTGSCIPQQRNTLLFIQNNRVVLSWEMGMISDGSEIISSFVRSGESLSCLKVCSLILPIENSIQKSYLLIGTSSPLANPSADMSGTLRLVDLSLDDENNLKVTLLAECSTEGAVSAVEVFNNYLIVGVEHRVIVMEVVSDRHDRRSQRGSSENKSLLLLPIKKRSYLEDDSFHFENVDQDFNLKSEQQNIETENNKLNNASSQLPFKLLKKATHSANCFCVDIQKFSDAILVADMQRSCSVVQFRDPSKGILDEIARDANRVSVVSVLIVDDIFILESDDSKNIILLKRSGTHPLDSDPPNRLTHSGRFHLGQQVNTMRSVVLSEILGTKVLRTSEDISDSSKLFPLDPNRSIVWGSCEGSVGVFVRIPTEKSFRNLKLLTTACASHMVTFGDLDPIASSNYATEETLAVSHSGFIDGNIIEAFLSCSVQTQEKIFASFQDLIRRAENSSPAVLRDDVHKEELENNKSILFSSHLNQSKEEINKDLSSSPEQIIDETEISTLSFSEFISQIHSFRTLQP